MTNNVLMAYKRYNGGYVVVDTGIDRCGGDLVKFYGAVGLVKVSPNTSSGIIELGQDITRLMWWCDSSTEYCNCKDSASFSKIECVRSADRRIDWTFYK